MGRHPIDHDRLIAASLHGASSRRANTWRMPTGEALDAAVAELREIAGGRTDLLGEVAGILLGVADANDDSRAVQATVQAELLILAGADPAAVQRWRPVGTARVLSVGPPLSRHTMLAADVGPHRWPPHGTRQRDDQPPCPTCKAPTERVYYVAEPASVIGLPCGHRTFVIGAGQRESR